MSSSDEHKSNASKDVIECSNLEGSNDGTYLSSDVQDLYPQTHILPKNGLKSKPSPGTDYVSKIVRSSDCHQDAKVSETLADNLRNIKNQIKNKPLNPTRNDEDILSNVKPFQQGITNSNGFIKNKVESKESPTNKPSPFPRTSLAAAVVSSSFSGEDGALNQPVIQPQTTLNSKVMSVLQKIKISTNKSKILMILALCGLCLPGNIVTIWLKIKQHGDDMSR